MVLSRWSPPSPPAQMKVLFRAAGVGIPGDSCGPEETNSMPWVLSNILAPGDGSLSRSGISLLFVSLQTSPSPPLPHVSPCFLLLSPLDMRGLTRSSPWLQEHFGSSSVSHLSKQNATKYTFCFIPMPMVTTYILTHSSSFTSHKPTLTSGSHL